LLYQNEKNYSAAEPLYKRSLAIYEKSLGPTTPVLAGTLVNVAQFYEEQAKYAAAEPLYRRALAIYEKSAGPASPRVASTLEGLAAMLRKAGRSEEHTSELQ